MAIISGMKAATVDDVKPFELPADALALGITARQKQADDAKKNYSIGASSLNFETRALDNDINLKQTLADEYQKDVQGLLESKGNDWSRVSNADLMSLAVKKAQDKRTIGLINANTNRKLVEEQAHEIEKNNGEALVFGHDARSADIFDEKGQLINFYPTTVEKQLDYYKKAQALYSNDIGHTLMELANFSPIRTRYRNSTDPNDNGLTEFYDYWSKNWEQNKTNNPQIKAIMDNMLFQYKTSTEGIQYLKLRNQQDDRLGLPKENRQAKYDNEIEKMIHGIGRSMMIDEHKETKDRQHVTYPNEGGGGGARKGTGDDKSPIIQGSLGIVSPYEIGTTGLGNAFDFSSAISATTVYKQGDKQGSYNKLPADLTSIDALANLPNVTLQDISMGFTAVPSSYYGFNINANDNSASKRGTLLEASGNLFSANGHLEKSSNHNPLVVGGARYHNRDLSKDTDEQFNKILSDAETRKVGYDDRYLLELFKSKNITDPGKALVNFLHGQNTTQGGMIESSFKVDEKGRTLKLQNPNSNDDTPALETQVNPVWKELDGLYSSKIGILEGKLAKDANGNVIPNSSADYREYKLLKQYRTNLQDKIQSSEAVISIITSETEDDMVALMNDSSVKKYLMSNVTPDSPEYERKKEGLAKMRYAYKNYKSLVLEKHTDAENKIGLQRMVKNVTIGQANLPQNELDAANKRISDLEVTGASNVMIQSLQESEARAIQQVAFGNELKDTSLLRLQLEIKKMNQNRQNLNSTELKNLEKKEALYFNLNGIAKQLVTGSYDFSGLNNFLKTKPTEYLNFDKNQIISSAAEYLSILNRENDINIKQKLLEFSSEYFTNTMLHGTDIVLGGRDENGNLKINYNPAIRLGDLQQQFNQTHEQKIDDVLKTESAPVKNYLKKMADLKNEYSYQVALYKIDNITQEGKVLNNKIDTETRNSFIAASRTNLGATNIRMRKATTDLSAPGEIINLNQQQFWQLHIQPQLLKTVPSTDPKYTKYKNMDLNQFMAEKEDQNVLSMRVFGGVFHDRNNIHGQTTGWNALYTIGGHQIEIPMSAELTREDALRFGVKSETLDYGEQARKGLQSSNNLYFDLSNPVDPNSSARLRMFVCHTDVTYAGQSLKKGSIIMLGDGNPKFTLADAGNDKNPIPITTFESTESAYRAANQFFNKDNAKLSNALNAFDSMDANIRRMGGSYDKVDVNYDSSGRVIESGKNSAGLDNARTVEIAAQNFKNYAMMYFQATEAGESAKRSLAAQLPKNSKGEPLLTHSALLAIKNKMMTSAQTKK